MKPITIAALTTVVILLVVAIVLGVTTLIVENQMQIPEGATMVERRGQFFVPQGQNIAVFATNQEPRSAEGSSTRLDEAWHYCQNRNGCIGVFRVQGNPTRRPLWDIDVDGNLMADVWYPTFEHGASSSPTNYVQQAVENRRMVTAPDIRRLQVVHPTG